MKRLVLFIKLGFFPKPYSNFLSDGLINKSGMAIRLWKFALDSGSSPEQRETFL